MKSCTFFGHRDTPETVRAVLHEQLVTLIERRGVDTFYVGNQGNFDRMVHLELKALTAQYPQIRYSVVLAYLPSSRKNPDEPDPADTIYPPGLETVPPRFAVDKRNHMMLSWSDFVITYVSRPGGGAAKFKALALKMGKEIVELSSSDSTCVPVSADAK